MFTDNLPCLRDGLAVRVRALSGYDFELGSDQCIVVSGETFLVGRIAVTCLHRWRSVTVLGHELL